MKLNATFTVLSYALIIIFASAALTFAGDHNLIKEERFLRFR
jgi:hypothetical protein